MIVGLFTLGPMMLPLVWSHPALHRRAKIIWTVLIAAVIAVITFWLLKFLSKSFDQLKAYQDLLKEYPH